MQSKKHLPHKTRSDILGQNDRSEKCWPELSSHYFGKGKMQCECGKRKITEKELRRYMTDSDRRGNDD
jgi:hypothetical protein